MATDGGRSRVGEGGAGPRVGMAGEQGVDPGQQRLLVGRQRICLAEIRGGDIERAQTLGLLG